MLLQTLWQSQKSKHDTCLLALLLLYPDSCADLGFEMPSQNGIYRLISCNRAELQDEGKKWEIGAAGGPGVSSFVFASKHTLPSAYTTNRVTTLRLLGPCSLHMVHYMLAEVERTIICLMLRCSSMTLVWFPLLSESNHCWEIIHNVLMHTSNCMLLLSNEVHTLPP